MKHLLLLGFLLLIIAITHASGFDRINPPEISQFEPDSNFISKLPFSIPTGKAISDMIKTGLNPSKLDKSKSIVLWIHIESEYIPNENEFFTDSENNIYLRIKEPQNEGYYRAKFDFFNIKVAEEVFNSKGKLTKRNRNFTLSIGGVPLNQPDYSKWRIGISGSLKMHPILPHPIGDYNSSAICFSIYPPMYFSTAYMAGYHNAAGIETPASRWYQIVFLPSLEDLINIVDDPTKQKVIDYIFSNKNNVDYEYCLRSPSIKSFADEQATKEKNFLLAEKAKTDENAFNQVKSKAIVFYAKEISQEVARSPLFAPKDEFETLNSFQVRQKNAEEFKKEVDKKYTQMYKDHTEKKEVERIEKIKNSYTHVNLKIAELGTYNAEKQLFPVTFEGAFRPIDISVPIQDAKSFKANLKDVKVVADKQLIDDAITFQFFNFELTHPITGMKYTYRKLTPLYLDYVSKDMAVDGVPKLDATVKFIEPSGNDLLDGDEKAKFEVAIKNSGTGTAQNVKINLSAIDKNGFTFDKSKSVTGIAPNQSQTLVFEVNADRKINSKEIPFKFEITESRGFNPAEILYSISTQAFKTPNLAVKDIGIKEVTGNNNSIIENGEKIEVSVLVQNTGQGKTENTQAVFDISDKNILTLSPDRMIQNIGALNPGESRLLTFDFTVNNIYAGSDLLPIKVVLSEKYNEYGGTFPLKLEMKKVQLATKNIKISGQYAQNIEIEDISLTAETDKNIPETGAKNPNRFALIIGNEDYKSLQPDLNSEINVLFAENDAKIVKEYAVKTLGVPEENITLLINATAGRMNQALAKMNLIAKNSNGKAELIFYYAGHGLPDENTKEPYLIPVDVSGANFLESGIKLKNAYAKLTEFQSKKVSVFIDACFSGGARNQGLLSARGIKIKPKETSLIGDIVVFSASTSEQSSLPYQDKKHGMFTYYLLKKIQDTKGDISLKELSDYVIEQVRLQSVNINNKEQTPVVNAGTDTWGIWLLR